MNTYLTIRDMKHLSELTGLYSLSKTLRFELKPVGKTLEHIESKGLIAQDEKRAEEYKKVKDIIDRYHKDFISMCLHNFKLDQNDLETYVALAENSNRDENLRGVILMKRWHSLRWQGKGFVR